MKSIHWTLGAIVVLGAVSSEAWLAYHRLGKHQTTTPASAVEDGESLVLHGVLKPAVTIPIDEVMQTLTVPLGAWVSKGQVIGEAVSRPGSGHARQIAAVAAADGFVVAVDAAAGKFGIASDPARLNTAILVPADVIRSLRVGEAAVVSVENLPETRFGATVSKIAAVPIEIAGEAGYRVRFDVDNPEKVLRAGDSVKVQAKN